MNSSIFISEPRAWRGVLRCYAAVCVVLGLVLAAFLIALDPYDAGVFGIFDGYGVPRYGARLTDASLARRPEVEGAMIGNSTSQLIDPARLTEQTGLHFVSLAIPGTGPIEQLTVAHWLVRHHHGGDAMPLKALVFGLDTSWCRGDGKLEVSNPFPFWLYSDSRLEYVAHLISLKSFEAAERKLKLMLAVDPPFRADGYRDYDENRVWDRAAAARDSLVATDDIGETGLTDFDAARRLRDFLREVPRTAAVILVFVPRYYSSLPLPESAAARQQDRCKEAFGEVAAARERTLLVDLLVDDPLAREAQNFWDRIHYRKPVARVVEGAIAEALGGANRR